MEVIMNAVTKFYPRKDVAINATVFVPGKGWLVYFEYFDGTKPLATSDHEHRACFVHVGEDMPVTDIA